MKLLLLICMTLMMMSCTQSLSTEQINEIPDIEKEKLNDSLSVFFDEYIKVSRNGFSNFSAKKKLPLLKNRVDSTLKSTRYPSYFSEMNKLVELYNPQFNLNKKRIDSLNQVVVSKIYTHDKLNEIRNLYQNPFKREPSNSVENSISDLIEYYTAINNIQAPLFFRDSLRSQIWKICPIYWELISETWKEKKPKIRGIKEKILLKNDVPEVNKKLLQTLLSPSSLQDTIPTFKRVIAAVFKSTDGLLAIHQMDTKSRGDSLLISKTHISDSLKSQPFIGDRLFKDFSVIEKVDSMKIYGFSENKRFEVDLFSVGYQITMCLEPYYVYNFLPKEEIKNDKVVFTSSLPLELDFGGDIKVDSLLYKHNFAICYDCASGWASSKVVAKLKGYEDIYFVVTIGEEGIDDAETYIRSLRYIDKDVSFSLWSEEFDAFGCSCL